MPVLAAIEVERSLTIDPSPSRALPVLASGLCPTANHLPGDGLTQGVDRDRGIALVATMAECWAERSLYLSPIR